MNKIKITRKAISPLIATILLVAVALSLAGILYSWSSQNFRDTTTSVSDTSAEWIDCSNVVIYIDGCSYNNQFNGLIISNRSTINIDQNIVLTVIDATNEIFSAEFVPNFTGNMMSLDTLANDSGFTDLATPLKRVQVHAKNCPDRMSFITRCN